MSNNQPDDESAIDSQQESEQQAPDSDQPVAQSDEQPADSEQSTEQSDGQPAETSDQSAEQTDEQAIKESDQTDEQAIKESDQPDDDCSGWEQDPESFSTYVAKYVAKMQIAPNVDVLAKSVACKDERHCDVTLSNGVVMRVAWEPRTRITLGRWDSNGVVLRSIYTYSCRAGQLILTFKDFTRGSE